MLKEQKEQFWGRYTKTAFIRE